MFPHSSAGRGNLVLKHSVPNFLLDSGGIALCLACFNITFILLPKWRRNENNSFPQREINPQLSHLQADTSLLCYNGINIWKYKTFFILFQSTGQCKGFAYVHFKFRADAAKAIQTLNGYGYDHLILNVEWSKPPQNN